MSSKNTNIINAIQIKKRKSAYGGFELLNGGFDLTNGGFWMIIGGKNGLFFPLFVCNLLIINYYPPIVFFQNYSSRVAYHRLCNNLILLAKS